MDNMECVKCMYMYAYYAVLHIKPSFTILLTSNTLSPTDKLAFRYTQRCEQ
ncbi:hypothetical protein NDU88_001435, partial [Pleurodeles waltl]